MILRIVPICIHVEFYHSETETFYRGYPLNCIKFELNILAEDQINSDVEEGELAYTLPSIDTLLGVDKDIARVISDDDFELYVRSSNEWATLNILRC